MSINSKWIKVKTNHLSNIITIYSMTNCIESYKMSSKIYVTFHNDRILFSFFYEFIFIDFCYSLLEKKHTTKCTSNAIKSILNEKLESIVSHSYTTTKSPLPPIFFTVIIGVLEGIFIHNVLSIKKIKLICINKMNTTDKMESKTNCDNDINIMETYVFYC